MTVASTESSVEIDGPDGSPATPPRRGPAMPAMLHSIDGAGRLISVSDAWLEKLRYRREQVLGRPYTDFLSPECREQLLHEGLPELSGAEGLDNVERRMIRGDGRAIDVLLSAVSELAETPGSPASVAVLTDITDRKIAERRLAESEALYRALVEEQTEMISLATPCGELLFVNRAYAQFYGMRPDDLVGRNLFEFVPPERRAMVAEHLRKVCETGVGEEDENEVRLSDGRTRWIAWTNRALIDAAGEVTHIHSVGRDIQRRVEAERRLKESEARHRLLAENATDMFLIVREDMTPSYCSPASRALLGYEPEEMVAIPTRDTIHPDDFPLVCAAWKEDRKTLAHRMRRKDGRFVWVESVVQRIAGEPGHAGARFLVVREIEQRVAAEQRLKENEAKYRLLADNSTDMVFQLDLDLVRRYVSPASREILGYEPSELIGVKPLDRCHPDDAERVALAFQRVLSGECDRQTVINRRQHRDGRWIWVEAQLRAFRDSGTREIRGMIGALRDISIRKYVEDQLTEAHARLKFLAARDGLTGLSNRRTFDEALSREWLRALREKSSLALIMLDVDRFKLFNDRYGHPAGDGCLREVAGVVEAAIRQPSALAARYGGEEFAVVLPDTDEGAAAAIAEGIRNAIRSLSLEHEAGVDRVVTVSAGVAATTQGARCEGVGILLREADRALYRAKALGRNRIVCASCFDGAGPARSRSAA